MNRHLAGMYRDWTDGRRSFGLFCFGAVARFLSWAYYPAMTLHQRWRHRRLLKPLSHASLVVVSSPLVGGTGKTPFAALLARNLRDLGHHPVLVTKGYGRSGRGEVVVDSSSGLPSATAAGDEAVMLWEDTRVPVHVGDEPADVIAKLDCSEIHDTVIFDDGLSRRWRNERRVAVISSADCDRAVDYVPYGRWRTSPRTLAHASGIAVVGEDIPDQFTQSRQRSRISAWGFRGPVGWYRTVVAGITQLGCGGTRPPEQRPPGSPLLFCGLGMPGRFFAQVAQLGWDSGAQVPFPDHHAYTSEDIKELETQCRDRESSWLLTTHKDAVKIDPAWLSGTPLYFLRISLDLVAGEDMIPVILQGS